MDILEEKSGKEKETNLKVNEDVMIFDERDNKCTDMSEENIKDGGKVHAFMWEVSKIMRKSWLRYIYWCRFHIQKEAILFDFFNDNVIGDNEENRELGMNGFDNTLSE